MTEPWETWTGARTRALGRVNYQLAPPSCGWQHFGANYLQQLTPGSIYSGGSLSSLVYCCAASMGGTSYGEKHGVIIALCVLVPTLFLVGIVVILYICCSRRYKLNWFERTLLDTQGDTSDGERERDGLHAPEVERRASAPLDKRELSETSAVLASQHTYYQSHPQLQQQQARSGQVSSQTHHLTHRSAPSISFPQQHFPQLQHQPKVYVSGAPSRGGAQSSLSKYLLLVSDSSLSNASMGSVSSTPSETSSSRVSPRGSLTAEQFWVPPAIIQKKRAQSLIPSLLAHHADSDDSK